MNIIPLKFAGILLTVSLGITLGGCAGGANYHVQDMPGTPLPRQALADEVYLDGTGPSARRITGARDYAVESQPLEALQVAPPPAGAPAHAVVRTRPTAIPRADDMSASTTGARNSAQGDANKPFTDQWWEKERREDAQLRNRMNICRGC